MLGIQPLQPCQHGAVSLNTTARPCCCLVVGMHNSGTSLVGNLLDAAGIPLGDQLLLRAAIPEAKRPRYDYFEDAEVVALQDATLLELQRHWTSYRASFPLPATDSPVRKRFRGRLSTLVRQRLRGARLWVVKDPRSGVLLDDWLQVLRELDLEAKLLIVHREPRSSIDSFSSKAGVPRLWAEALWQRTYSQALAAAEALADDQVLITAFETLLAAPEQETRRLCRFLQWSPPRDLSERVASRIDHALPTQNGRDGPTGSLHPATQQLELGLQGVVRSRSTPAADDLLCQAMQTALAEAHDALELNALHADGQTLLPKVSVWIVTAELQGWGRCGGIGSAYRELAEALAEAAHGVRVLLVAPGHDTPPQPLPRLQVQRLDPSGLSRLELSRRVAGILQAEPADVVHLHEWLGLGSGLRSALGSDHPPLIIGLHGPSAWTRLGNPWPRSSDGALAVEEELLYEEGLVRALERDAIAQADLLVAPSRFMAEWVQQNGLTANAPARVAVQRNCSLRQRPEPPPADAAAMAIPLHTLVFFGRLEQRKGLLLFLEALEQMQAPPRQVVFLGSDCRIQETHWASELAEERLARLGIACSLHSDLERDQALALLQALQAVVVIPSLIENSPCVVEELLGSGLRLVVTDVSGSGELITDDGLAWLSAAEPAALAQHLQRALSLRDAGAYRLEPRIPPWWIALSWQAFHERLPRRGLPQPAAAPVASHPVGPRRRGRRAVAAMMRRLGLRHG